MDKDSYNKVGVISIVGPRDHPHDMTEVFHLINRAQEAHGFIPPLVLEKPIEEKLAAFDVENELMVSSISEESIADLYWRVSTTAAMAGQDYGVTVPYVSKRQKKRDAKKAITQVKPQASGLLSKLIKRL